ncbi:MAG: trans-sulfuration enzyme family protein [Desulfatibacillaceae bacterium]
MAHKSLRPETQLIHAGEPRPLIEGAVSMPVFQSSTFQYTGQSDYNALRYIRMNNTPNHRALHEKIAALEGAEAALVSASGMAAISTTLFGLLSPGDHILAQDSLYGGTHTLIRGDLARFGVTCDFIDASQPDTWESMLRDNTKMVYVESVTNPLMHVGDLRAVAAFAKKHRLLSVIDNTFPTPVLFRPLTVGYDMVAHSCTKYMNGHSDIVGGAIAGSRELVDRVLHCANHLGGCMDPHACFLLHRGLKTLAVRMERHCENAQAMAEWLESLPGVTRVAYPGLPSHASHANARDLFSGFGGMLSFELDGDAARADRFIKRLKLPIEAPSLGGVETLITRPSTTSHAGMSPEDREKAGISDSLIRVSVGIEDVEDLKDDFRQALEG